jgi:hypothetical protein
MYVALDFFPYKSDIDCLLLVWSCHYILVKNHLYGLGDKYIIQKVVNVHTGTIYLLVSIG